MGKHALVSTLTLVLVLVSILQAWTTAEEDVVRDTQGNPLQVGSEYSIRAVGSGLSGPPIGRSAKPGTVIPCPLYAIVPPNIDDPGQPVKFIPVDETETQIHLSSPVQIDSGFSAYCRSDGLWKMTIDPLNRRPVIVAAGAFGVPATTFKIQLTPIVGPLRYAYKITAVGKEGSEDDQDVTTFSDFTSPLKLLGLFGQPLYVIFVKNPMDEVGAAGVVLE